MSSIKPVTDQQAIDWQLSPEDRLVRDKEMYLKSFRYAFRKFLGLPLAPGGEWRHLNSLEDNG